MQPQNYAENIHDDSKVFFVFFIYLKKDENENVVSFSVLRMLEKELHPLAEKWSKVKLEHTSTYGIR